jgi:hypothetical protein
MAPPPQGVPPPRVPPPNPAGAGDVNGDGGKAPPQFMFGTINQGILAGAGVSSVGGGHAPVIATHSLPALDPQWGSAPSRAHSFFICCCPNPKTFVLILFFLLHPQTTSRDLLRRRSPRLRGSRAEPPRTPPSRTRRPTNPTKAVTAAAAVETFRRHRARPAGPPRDRGCRRAPGPG